MGEVLKRFFTIIFCVALTVPFILYNVTTLVIYYSGVVVICLIEYHYKINTPRKKTTIGISLIIYELIVLSTIGKIEGVNIYLAIPFMFFLFSVELFFGIKNPLLNIGTDLIGLVWICFPMYLCTLMSFNPQGEMDSRLVIGMMLLVWFNDAGAYCIGRIFGKTRLFKRISPNKTWEGSIGGAIIATITCIPVARYFTFLSLKEWRVILVICIVCGCVGDLIESMFKRDLKIKDTSGLLPGHGGVLDRVDALLYSTPFVFTYLKMIEYF